MERPMPVPTKYRKQFDAAVALSESPEMSAAFDAVRRDPDLALKANDDPRGVLAQFGVDVPRGLDVRLLGLSMPGPGWEPWSIRLTNCRSYWVRNKETGKWEQVEVCFGWEIVPGRPPGPLG
jgi:hypothetical protein